MSLREREVVEGPPAGTADAPPGRVRSGGSSEVWVIEPPSAGPLFRPRDLWLFRRLLRYFFITTIRFSYKATILSWAWLIIRPVVPVAVFTIVFQKWVGVQTDVPYVLFFLVGTAIFHLFEESLIWMTRSFQIHRSTIKRYYFPRIMVPAGSIGPAFVEFLVYMAIVVAATVYIFVVKGSWWIRPTQATPLVLAALVLALILALGIGMFTSVLGAEHRDIRFTLRYFCRFWYFFTPIMYSPSLIAEDWRWALVYNPMATIVEMFRWGIFGIGDEIALDQVGVMLVMVGAIFGAGAWFFARAESSAVDRL